MNWAWVDYWDSFNFISAKQNDRMKTLLFTMYKPQPVKPVFQTRTLKYNSISNNDSYDAC